MHSLQMQIGADFYYDVTLTLTLDLLKQLFINRPISTYCRGLLLSQVSIHSDQGFSFYHANIGKEKVKVRTLDTAPLRESSPQKRSGMARVHKGSHSFTCTPTCSIRNRNEPYLPLPSEL